MPRVTVLALFYESVNRLTETRKEHDNKNKLDKRIKTTNPSKIDAICAQDMWKFNFMLDFSIGKLREFPIQSVINTFVY